MIPVNAVSDGFFFGCYVVVVGRRNSRHPRDDVRDGARGFGTKFNPSILPRKPRGSNIER